MYLPILECFKINEVILNQVNSEIACDHMFIFFHFSSVSVLRLPTVIRPYQSNTTMAHQAIKEAGVGDLSQHMPSLVRSVPECKFFGLLMLIVR